MSLRFVLATLATATVVACVFAPLMIGLMATNHLLAWLPLACCLAGFCLAAGWAATPDTSRKNGGVIRKQGGRRLGIRRGKSSDRVSPD